MNLPTSGRSVATKAFCDAAESDGVEVERFDTARHRDRSVEPALRTWTYLRACVRTLRRGRSAVYLAFPDGAEIPLAILLVSAASVRRRRVVIHHHSRRYVDRRFRMLAVLAVVQRRCAVTHVVQCEPIARALKSKYRFDEVRSMSNAALVVPPPLDRSDSSQLVLGFFGRISEEKGIMVFLDTAEVALSQSPEVRVVVAGEGATASVRSRLDDLVGRYPERADVRGALFGVEKFRMLASLDVLMFPTSYRTEMDPLVTLEALAVGTTVVGSDLGCLPANLAGTPGRAVPLAECSDSAISVLMGATGRSVREQNQRRFGQLQDDALAVRVELVELLVG